MNFLKKAGLVLLAYILLPLTWGLVDTVFGTRAVSPQEVPRAWLSVLPAISLLQALLLPFFLDWLMTACGQARPAAATGAAATLGFPLPLLFFFDKPAGPNSRSISVDWTFSGLLAMLAVSAVIVCLIPLPKGRKIPDLPDLNS